MEGRSSRHWSFNDEHDATLMRYYVPTPIVSGQPAEEYDLVCSCRRRYSSCKPKLHCAIVEPDCSNEIFHLECVGLPTCDTDDDEWFCLRCRGNSIGRLRGTARREAPDSTPVISDADTAMSNTSSGHVETTSLAPAHSTFASQAQVPSAAARHSYFPPEARISLTTPTTPSISTRTRGASVFPGASSLLDQTYLSPKAAWRLPLRSQTRPSSTLVTTGPFFSAMPPLDDSFITQTRRRPKTSAQALSHLEIKSSLTMSVPSPNVKPWTADLNKAFVTNPDNIIDYDLGSFEKAKTALLSRHTKEDSENEDDGGFDPNKTDAKKKAASEKSNLTPASTPKRTKITPTTQSTKRSWSEEEDKALIAVIKELTDRGLCGEPMWQAAEPLYRQRGFNRSNAGMKMRWCRGLREQSKIDERRHKSEQLLTALQSGKVKGAKGVGRGKSRVYGKLARAKEEMERRRGVSQAVGEDDKVSELQEKVKGMAVEMESLQKNRDGSVDGGTEDTGGDEDADMIDVDSDELEEGEIWTPKRKKSVSALPPTLLPVSSPVPSPTPSPIPAPRRFVSAEQLEDEAIDAQEAKDIAAAITMSLIESSLTQPTNAAARKRPLSLGREAMQGMFTKGL